jgi:hypothetical protein
MSFSDFMENAILNAILRNTSLVGGTTIYLGLHTADPTDAGTGTEVSGGSYARQGLTSGFPAASGSSGSVANSSNITFPQASGSWGTITHVQLWSASTSGNAYWSGALTASKVVGSGDTFQIDAGDLTATVD